jgi:L-seryl-tRNA(Ser) seleniumtransferase
VLDEFRAALRGGETTEVPDAAAVAIAARARLDCWLIPGPVRVINATGVLLHTNLGRAPLSAAATKAMAAAAGYCDLEVSLEDGRRSSRFDRVRPLLTSLLGAQDVHVVNNNAAGLLLACTAVAGSAGVVLSRGQMVEIGDGFRVTTMASAGGCPVWAVGSTNRTHLADYEAALAGELPEMGGAPASALLWVHLSNFRQDGFVTEVDLTAMAELARVHSVPLIADLGSGSMGEGLPGDEPTITGYLQAGADLVLASGDKLLGGPQAGIIAGRADLVERCRRHPMARALRPDKTTLAALHATVIAHTADGLPDLPLHHAARVTVDELRARAEQIRVTLGWGPEAVRETRATVGGGSLPGDEFGSIALAVPGDHPSRVARRLRLGEPSVMGRIERQTLLLDLRTVGPAEDPELTMALRGLSSTP